MATPKKFSGTSRKGDLSEALDAAIAAAHGDLHSDLINWRLDEVRGSSGGFVGARNVTVTVEASATGPKPAAKTAGLAAQSGAAHCGGWHAWHNRMPPGEPTLHATGVCSFPTTGYKVELRPAVPQGINPSIYLLKKVVTPPTDPVNQVVTEVPVHFGKKLARTISHVQILPDGVLVPVESVF